MKKKLFFQFMLLSADSMSFAKQMLGSNLFKDCAEEDVVTTKTGHKLLPAYIRVIQGDGVDYESIPKILGALKDAGE